MSERYWMFTISIAAIALNLCSALFNIARASCLRETIRLEEELKRLKGSDK